MIGKTVSHYKILEKLGEGGMGVVYKAEDTRLKRTVALKFLPHGLQSHEPERARFLQEAQAASALNHPNVCTIYDIAEVEGQQFIVMEYIDGKTLRQIVPVRSIQAAVNYAIQIGEALQEAHSKGIVHRDVKTDNVMVNSKDQVKVMDFGLAKLKGSLKLTKTSSTVGTLAYMAPEQIEGKETDARSDIFSFGVVLYELLTGHLPFRGEHEAAMVYSIVNDEPVPVHKYLPEIPSELMHILDRALEKDPGDRYQNVAEMVIDLRRMKKQSGRVSTTIPAARPSEAYPEKVAEPSGRFLGIPRSRVMWVALAGGFVVLAAGVLAIVVSRGPELNPDMTFRVVQIPFQNVWYADVSRDGNWLYFPAADENGKFDIYMMNMAGGTPKRTTNDSCEAIFSVTVSPDASTILYGRYDAGRRIPEIVSVPTLGGTSRVVIENGDAQDWRPDGKRISYLVSRVPSTGKLTYEFWTSAPDGSDRRCEFVDTVINRPGLRRGSFWSRDGTSITWVRNFPEGHVELFVHNLETGRERQLTFDKKVAEDGLWSPTGHIIYSSNRTGDFNLWSIPVSGGDPVQVTRGSGPDVPVWISSDGRKIVYNVRQQITQVKVLSLESNAVRQLTVEDRLRGSPSISRSGSGTVFPEQEGDVLSYTRNLYLVDGKGKNRRKLTDDNTFKSSPFWSPDEKWITYGSRFLDEPAESTRVFLLKVDSPGRPRLVGKGHSGYWCSDSQFVVWDPPCSFLASLNRDGYEKIAEDSIWACPVLEGMSLLLWDRRANRGGVWIAPAVQRAPSGMAGARQLLKSAPVSLRVAQKADELFYIVPTTLEMRRVSLRDGTDKAVGMKLSRSSFEFDVRSDGKEIVYLDNYSKVRFVVIENVFK
jgi:Tol biopolymer transport system component/predicted Ser/Thr protein kinase